MNRIYYHMCAMNDYHERFIRTYNKILSSELIDFVDSIQVVAVGSITTEVMSGLKDFPKVSLSVGDNPNNESNTLHKLWDDCQSFNGNILYLHSKGVSRIQNENIQSWIDYMEYFCIENFEKCLDSLEEYDTVGVNLQQSPMTHYSGNFWWAKSRYIKSRDRFDRAKSKISVDERAYAEFWLLDSQANYPLSLHQSDVNHYEAIYEKSKYNTQRV